MEQKTEKFIKKQFDVFVRKNRDYGNSFFLTCDKYGEVAYLIRAGDKLLRIKTLINGHSPEVEESLMDSVLDLFNYTVMLTMWEDKKTEHEDFLERANRLAENNFSRFKEIIETIDIESGDAVKVVLEKVNEAVVEKAENRRIIMVSTTPIVLAYFAEKQEGTRQGITRFAHEVACRLKKTDIRINAEFIGHLGGTGEIFSETVGQPPPTKAGGM